MTKKTNLMNKRSKDKLGYEGSDRKLVIVLVSTLILAILIIVAFIWTSF